MVNRSKQNGSREIEKLSRSVIAESRSNKSELLASKKNPIKDKSITDELIVSLADAHENKRAQQVIEWEKMRRLAMHA